MTPFVVTGTGRSGTRFMSNVLQAAGVNCGHEKVFTLKAGNRNLKMQWADYQADSSWIAVPYLPRLTIPSFLIVRHPLHTVRSMLELGWFGHKTRTSVSNIVYKHRPEIQAESDRPNKCLAFWYHWNLAALPYVDNWYRLESLLHTGDRHCSWVYALKAMGVDEGTAVKLRDELSRIGEDSDKRNMKLDAPRENWRIGWNSFRPKLRDAVIELADKFGYQEQFEWH